jgi:hypothetical protein
MLLAALFANLVCARAQFLGVWAPPGETNQQQPRSSAEGAGPTRKHVRKGVDFVYRKMDWRNGQAFLVGYTQATFF